MRRRIYRIGTLIGLSMLAVPALIYVVGRALVGPYEGPLGLLGLIGHIYSDASLGHLSAWFLSYWFGIGWRAYSAHGRSMALAAATCRSTGNPRKIFL